MTMHDYQDQASSTAIYPGRGELMGLIYTALKLTGEAGEVSEKIGKLLRDDGGRISPEKRIELTHELGDVLWYVSQMARELGLDLEDVARGNLAKLASRQQRGQLQGSGDNR